MVVVDGWDSVRKWSVLHVNVILADGFLSHIDFLHIFHEKICRARVCAHVVSANVVVRV